MLSKKKHQQRPVIFNTNGYDIGIWNDAAKEPPRKVYGFYSRNSLQHFAFPENGQASAC